MAPYSLRILPAWGIALITVGRLTYGVHTLLFYACWSATAQVLRFVACAFLRCYIWYCGYCKRNARKASSNNITFFIVFIFYIFMRCWTYIHKCGKCCFGYLFYQQIIFTFLSFFFPQVISDSSRLILFGTISPSIIG